MSGALTPKGRATRARIVTGAAEVLRERGVATATLDEICLRTGVSKGQLFHYFPGGREELLLAVAQQEADRVLDDQQPSLRSLDSWDTWDQWRDVLVQRYEAQGDTCPMGLLFAEVGRSSPGARAIVVKLMREWQQYLAAGIHALQRGGRLPASLDVDQTAAALLAGIQGGVAIMLSTGDSTNLKAALDWGIGRLRAAGHPLAE
ncbi:transcriptional regulator, TetR family [Streptomyces sp. DvalAA-14]|uniref:TetR/AcrR family transcriptional regulator n=1 Tax=unclassified Streptomyces TaxID=2593676 RepID=UPI00081B182A|nr:MULTISPECIES: TetR/AcrR family transcriptional regulator [unclassified Streptomyces]MYS20119.1 TetR family transcriptional regulator [Streptomyces sp. SID4948]SCD61354.1 transcriptional regulator, TetR family [Streptomyces sp. DvalAA-14]